MTPDVSQPALVVGRYSLHTEIASGGMATVYIGRLLGSIGFSRTVAVKRLHPHLARDPEFVAMFLDEARVVTRIRHPNVVPTLDVEATDGELFLVMEYIEGEPLSRLSHASLARGERIPPRIAASIISGALLGLHAAHEARDERGAPLQIVHRDVSPQNILVGVDGVARVVDFGVAKALNRIQTTREGSVKGKLSYMPPEQMSSGVVTRAADIYAAAVALWELLTCQRLFDGENEAIVVTRVLTQQVPRPSTLAPGISRELDDVVMRGVHRDPAARFATARDMALALEKAVGPVSVLEVAEWVTTVASQSLARRAAQIAAIEGASAIPSGRALSRAVAELTPTGGQAPPSLSEPIDVDTDPYGSTKIALVEAGAITPVSTPPATRRFVPEAARSVPPPTLRNGPEPISQVSSISTSRAMPPVPRAPTAVSGVAIGVAGILLVGAVAGGGVLLFRRAASHSQRPTIATSTPSTAPTESAAVAAVAAPQPQPSTIPPPASAAPAPSVAAAPPPSATAPAPSPSMTTSSALAPVRPAGRPVPAPRPPATAARPTPPPTPPPSPVPAPNPNRL